MTRHTPGRRAGFTLVELLVAMTVIVVLATIAVAVIPSAIDGDRAVDAAATVRQHLMIAKARATRENDPRGIRFIVDTATTDPVKIAAGNVGLFLSGEMQYIEAAPTMVPNPLGLTTRDPNTGLDPPFAQFDLSPAAISANQYCKLVNMAPANLAAQQTIQVINNDLGANWFPKLYCPELGTDAFGRTQRFEIQQLNQDPTNPTTYYCVLGQLPYTLEGSGTTLRSYRFAVEPRSRPLLGEPNVPLPRNVCVDLNPGVSVPGARSPVNNRPVDFEIMFAPNGQVIDPISSGVIHLWVRDYTKLADMTPTTVTPTYAYAAGQLQFQKGGEMQLVSIKAKTGSLGVFPVQWPNAAGTYVLPATGPYDFATKEATSP